MAAVAQRELGQPAGDGRRGRDAGRDLQHVVQERRGVQHPRDQADPERLVGVHDPAGEQQVPGVRLAHHLGQQVGAAHARVHAELHERHAQLGARGGVPQVAGEREAQAGADGGAVDRGDGRHLEAPDREPGPVERRSSGCGAGRPWRRARWRSTRCCRRSRTPTPPRSPRPPAPTGRRPARRRRETHEAVISSDIALRMSGLSRVSSGHAVGGSLDAQVGVVGHARTY